MIERPQSLNEKFSSFRASTVQKLDYVSDSVVAVAWGGFEVVGAIAQGIMSELQSSNPHKEEPTSKSRQ